MSNFDSGEFRESECGGTSDNGDARNHHAADVEKRVSETVADNITSIAAEPGSVIPQPPAADQPKPALAGDSKAGSAEGGIGQELSLPTVVEMSGLAFEKGLVCFHDSLGRPFANFPVPDPTPHRETWAISPKSMPVKAWLRSQAQEHFGVFLPKGFVAGVVDILEHVANTGKTIPLGNRLAYEDGKIILDVLDPAWQAIEVSASGWRIIQPDRPLFWRNAHQLPLPLPVRGESLDRLFDFVPVRDDRDRLLVITWLLSALKPQDFFVALDISKRDVVSRDLKW